MMQMPETASLNLGVLRDMANRQRVAGIELVRHVESECIVESEREKYTT